MADPHADPLADVFHHVRDYPYFELPTTLQRIGIGQPLIDAEGHVLGYGYWLPQIPFLPSPSKIVLWLQGALPPGETVWGFQLTRFMLLQIAAGLIALLIFRGLAKRLQGGKPTQGRWWNFWEAIALFIRDNVVRPTIGDPHHHHDDADHARHGDFVAGGEDIHVAHEEQSHLPPEEHPVPTGGHPADRYLPYVWTVFFYVLINNLLGGIPWLGTATGDINVTGTLALVTFVTVIFYGSQVSGPLGFWTSLTPTMDLPYVTKIVIVPLIWVIEVIGLLVKHGVLAVRLFANILAGHTVLAVILAFIAVAAQSPIPWLWYIVTPASILGQLGIGLLELFVSFLQAYIFAFLTTLFIATAVHPH